MEESRGINSREARLAWLKEQIAAVQEALTRFEQRLGGFWDRRKRQVVPFDDTVQAFAAKRGVALMSSFWLRFLNTVYMVLVFGLGLTYALLVSELTGAEGFLLWAARIALALAFVAGSLLVKTLWQHIGTAKFIESATDVARQYWTAVAATTLVLLLDLVLSYFFLRAAVDAATLGGSGLPVPVIWVMALLTGVAQLLGAFLGYQAGKWHGMRIIWWSELRESHDDDIEGLRHRTEQSESLVRELAKAAQLPAAHISWGK